MARRRILVALESRATYGYSKNVMLAMREFPDLELTTLVTGAHLEAELGNSVDLIRGDGFPITATVKMHTHEQAPGGWVRALGSAIAGYSEAYEKIAPDITLLSGDRIETLGCCIAAAYMGLPIAHIQAGDKSGHVDDAARLAMAKFVHVHFAACDDSAERLKRMGEQEFRIFNVGAPQLDSIIGRDFRVRTLTVNDEELDLTQPYLVLLQHPVLAEAHDAYAQMVATVEACVAAVLPTIWIYPNSDFGYHQILKVVAEHAGLGRIKVFRNVERDHFLTLLSNCAALVGNSSSGILEAPTFKVPVVNIGNRQRGRPQASNILNCGYERESIATAIDRALHDPEFKAACRRAVNPYGDGRSSERICGVLREISLDRKLLDKECSY